MYLTACVLILRWMLVTGKYNDTLIKNEDSSYAILFDLNKQKRFKYWFLYKIDHSIIPVTERSEDTGLVYPLSVVRRAERSKFTMKDYFSLEEQRANAKLAISGQKELSRQIKKCVKKVCKQDYINKQDYIFNSFHYVNIFYKRFFLFFFDFSFCVNKCK